MKLAVGWNGTEQPFEGEFAIPIDVIPEGARVTNARVRVTPIDPGGSFVEPITFGSSGRRWGANIVKNAQFIEVDFRARRALASLKGTGLTGARLQIDPGGTYVEINDRGAMRSPGDTLFALPAPGPDGRVFLPSFVVARFKLTPPGTSFASVDLNVVEVRSAPENVSLRLGDDPVFHTFLGQMTTAEVSADFAILLQDFLTRARVQNGYYSIPLVVHSDTIARLKLDIELEVLQAQATLPPGVSESVQSYSFDAVPAGAAASIPLSLPPDAQAVAGATSVHFLGSFADSRIAYGPIVPVESGLETEISSDPGQPQAQAQQFTLAENLSLTGIDLLVSATTPAARIQIDLRDDLGGKPGLASMLPTPLLVDLSSPASGKTSWVSVAFPAAIPINAGVSYWLIVQRSLGNAVWSVRTSSGLAMQQTTDGGLSWRQSSSVALEGFFRLRNRPAHFTMPIHVFAGEGDLAREVPLTRFEPLGRVDFTLDTGELAEAINAALSSTATENCSPVEHLDNREFEDWLRVGESPSPARTLPAAVRAPLAVALSPHGTTLYVLDRSLQNIPAIQIVDPICGRSGVPLQLPNVQLESSGFGSGLAITPDGKRLVAYLDGVVWLIDLAGNGVVANRGTPSLQSIANLSADNERLYFTRSIFTGTLPQSEVGSVKLTSLEDHLANGTTLSVDLGFSLVTSRNSRIVTLMPTALAVAPDGSRIYVTANESSGSRSVLWVLSTTKPGFEREVVFSFNPASFALHPDGQRAFVVAASSPQVQTISLATGAVLDTMQAASGTDSIHGVSMGAFSDGLLGLVAGPSEGIRTVKLIEFGVPAPEVWQLTSGKVAPYCLDEPFRIAAALGGLGDASSDSSSISQVVAASSGCTYEFSFWGLATADGAAGEILWRTGECTSPRRDVIPIQVVERRTRPILTNADAVRTSAQRVDSLKFHRLRVQSPDNAIGAEIRFRTTFDMAAIVDRVSFGTVDATLSNGDFLDVASGLPSQWAMVPANAPGFTFSRANEGARIANGGIQTIALTQRFAVKPSGKILVEIEAESVAANDPPFLQLIWADSVSSPVSVVLQPNTPRLRTAAIEVPPGVTLADFAIQVPAAARITISALRVLSDSRLSVPINVYAEAPGELTLSRVNVVTDRRPVRPPLTPSGPCPATPPGNDPSGEGCDYCSGCGQTNKSQAAKLVRSPSGRTALEYDCVTCRTTMLRSVLTATITRAAQTTLVKPLVLLRQSVTDLALRLQPPPITVTTPAPSVELPAGAVSLKAVIWIPMAERRKLESVGIRSLEALAAAPESLAAIALESAPRARQLIARTRKLLIEKT